MNVYINGIGSVTPQQNTDNNKFMSSINNAHGRSLWSIEPDYKLLIKVNLLRRMSRLMKMSIYAGIQCSKDAEVDEIDAIITSTGLGESQMTENFLIDIYNEDEGLVSPTPFIQSTHNTIGSQLAMILQCKEYNYTYVHRGASFESALLDASMLLHENLAQNVLVGSMDELTKTYLDITTRMNLWKISSFNQLDLLSQNSSGTLPGEGAAFFMLSKNINRKSYAKITGLRILYGIYTADLIAQEIINFIQENNLQISDIDVVILGLNGDRIEDNLYHWLRTDIFKSIQTTYFKHLCGEYMTAISFGLLTAAHMIKKNKIPSVMKIGDMPVQKIKHVLICNHYNISNHSFILVQDV